MKFGGLSWKLLLGNALLLAAAAAWFLWLAGGESRSQLIGRFDTLVLLAGGLLLLALAGTMLTLGGLRRRWGKSLQRISNAARALSAGDLSVRADTMGAVELDDLARALNELRSRLAGHTETIERQRGTLESLLSQIHEGVVLARHDGRILLINPAAVRLLHLRPGEGGRAEPTRRFVGKAVERVIPQLELQRMLHCEPAGPRPAFEEARVQLETDDGVTHVLARATDLVLPGEMSRRDQPVEGRLLLLTDITELARTVQIKTDFVANASHELRTPLTTIRTAVEALLEMDLAAQADAAGRFVQVIDRQSTRLVALVSDLLDLGRLESRSATFEPQHLSWKEVVQELEEHFGERLRANGLTWATQVLLASNGSPKSQGASDAGADTAPADAPPPLPPQLPQIVAHPYVLQLVLDNLVDNAIKFTPRGGSVTLTLRLGKQTAQIEVADTGCGVPEVDRERIFERFYQVERARSGATRGTGLGLSIVRHAVAALGGRVRVESQVGRGARFTVELPQPADLTRRA